MDPVKKFITFFKDSAFGRALLLGGIVVLVAYGGKLFYTDWKEDKRTRDARDARQRVESMAAALDGELSESKEPAEALGKLPKVSGWFPRDLPCGHSVEADPAGADAIWQTLGLEEKQSFRFQFRFEREDDEFEIKFDG